MEGVFSEEGNLTDVLRQDNHKNMIPSASTLQEAINYIRNLMGQLKESLLHALRFIAKSFSGGMEEKRHWDKVFAKRSSQKR